MNARTILSLLVMLVITTSVYAVDNTDAGAAEIHLMELIFTGNIGLFIGLAIAIIGIFNFVQGKIANAIILVVLGVIITLLPGIYNGLRMITCPIASSLGGHCGTD